MKILYFKLRHFFLNNGTIKKIVLFLNIKNKSCLWKVINILIYELVHTLICKWKLLLI